MRHAGQADHWIEMVLCLIALVPGFGDALKTVFHGLRSGKAMGRILDSLPQSVRGNIEKWFRELNWGGYTRQLIQSINNILGGLIDVLEYRIVQWVIGHEGIRRLVAQLRSLRDMAARRIEEAMESLHQAHARAIRDPLPNTTADVPGATNSAMRKTPTPESSAPGNVARTTKGTDTPKSGNASAKQRQSEHSNLNRSKIGVSGEHIADYFFVKRQHSRAKISQQGNLYEMLQPNHQGIDHVWHAARLPRGYRISDTKGTGGAFHRLENAGAALEALRYGIDAYLDEEDEGRARNVLGKTKNDGRQLSHRWVAKKISGAGLLPAHAAVLGPAIEAWELSQFTLGMQTTFEDGAPRRTLVKCPYDRSLITVVGPNHNLHERAAGVTTPRCLKPRTSHQISTEFVLPNHFLTE
jgi:hypothetical protein